MLDTLTDVPDNLTQGRNIRPPLPAGHPESWGAITRGTVLDGIPWPGPSAARATARMDELRTRE